MLGIFWIYNALNFSISFLVFTTSSSKDSHLSFFSDNCCFIISSILFSSSNSTFSRAKSSSRFYHSFQTASTTVFVSLLNSESVNLL
jgi:hypothetical protein